MSFIRKKPRQLKSGKIQDYYHVVENRWENGKVRQKVLEYRGTSPTKIEIPVEPDLAGQLAHVLTSGKLSHPELKETLRKLGIPVSPGKIKEVRLIFKPPLRKLTLRIL
jgi:hypothetical protein